MSSAVAIINWNSGRWLRPCIESLLATTTTAEILVIDNASGDDSLESVQGFRNRVDFVQNSFNRGFAAAVNQAFRATSAPYVLILNPDLRATPGAVQRLEEVLDQHPGAAAAGGYVGERYRPKPLPTVWSLVRENLGVSAVEAVSSRSSANGPRTGNDAAAYPVDQPAAAALLIRRDAYEEAEGFDEQFYPAWYEDVDFCARLKSKGWQVYFVPDAIFLHAGGYSAEALGSSHFLRSYYTNQIRYASKHFNRLGAAVVRASIALGMIGRMIARPGKAAAYGRAFLGTVHGAGSSKRNPLSR